MGFSSIAGTVIMIIALLICGAYLYSVIDEKTSKILTAQEEHFEYIYNKIHEKLVIVKVSKTPNQTNITVLNNGSTVLEPSKFSVIFDGNIVPSKNISYNPNKQYLFPLENITIIVNWTEPQRICIVSDTGNKYYS
ncbi:flagellin [Methanocaldococcus villosus KIN24-T80]|uniref:Flagellin n=1 Tax=Methanocaldococcus villosus KIN24-T80 TaxID=1069083 RepID=N6V0I5_9EURY|nr:hypothetical protein [Methanocaldococcus villosus]ENN95833.1 flagellin [Methanocaldococcus villosus KIN24-T80]